jgi:hypothetical protein
MDSWDITVDLANPHTRLDYTASVILSELQAGQQVMAGVLDRAIRRERRARLHLKATAFKALRNRGYPIIAVKASRLSFYQITTDEVEQEKFSTRVVREQFSQLITTCRELAGATALVPTSAVLAASHQATLTAAIALGGRLGIPVAEVVRMAAPLP